jgi:hypothetical protein
LRPPAADRAGAKKPKFAANGRLTYANGMLNGIHIVDFGNHRNTRLTFGPMTALVGKNGSGKTTVMRAIGEVGQEWKNTEMLVGAIGQYLPPVGRKNAAPAELIGGLRFQPKNIGFAVAGLTGTRLRFGPSHWGRIYQI